MKIRKLVTAAALLLAMTVAGCVDPVVSRQSVRDEFPGGEAEVIPGLEGRFVVRAVDGSIWYVQTLASGSTVSAKVQLMEPAECRGDR